MLSVNTIFSESDIGQIRLLKPNSVYLLTNSLGFKLVVKIDSFVDEQIKYANSVVKAIAPSAKLKLLNALEIVALRKYVHEFRKLDYDMWQFGARYRPAELDAINGLEKVLAHNPKAVKMEALDVVDLQKTLEVHLDPKATQSNLQGFADMLAAKGGLERLGEIVAMDLFVGNPDRFWPGEGRSPEIGGVVFELRCLANVSNVFRINLSDGSAEAGAIDFLYTNAEFLNIKDDLTDHEKLIKWPGKLLVAGATRKAFAADVVHDLELLLNPRKSPYSLKTKLGFFAASRVADGMYEGARRIKFRLGSKYFGKAWPKGLEDRYKIISQVH